MNLIFQHVIILQCRATNIENDEANNVKNQLSGQFGTVPEVARFYKVSSCSPFSEASDHSSCTILTLFTSFQISNLGQQCSMVCDWR